ncbi:MAG TPA: helix-turn-helix transcriptional regulator [Sphingobacteriaceae bacterium]
MSDTHIGRKISRIRELRGMKQESLAFELGVSQQAISKMEQSEKIEDAVLEKVASALGVSKEAVENYSDEAIFNIIGNHYHDNSSSLNYQCSFNPIDKLIEAYEENRKLFERLLASEREKVELLKGRKD